MPWLRGVFTRRFPHLDIDMSEQWMRRVVLPYPLQWHAVRTDDALCVSVTVTYAWTPNERDVTVIILLADFGKVWQTPALLRSSLAWARSRDASSWCYQSDTDKDIAPLMKRIGVPQAAPRFKANLKENTRWISCNRLSSSSIRCSTS